MTSAIRQSARDSLCGRPTSRLLSIVLLLLICASIATAQVVQTTGPRRYGVQFTEFMGSPMVVAGADAGSIADRAGVRAGDKILRLNGKAVAEMPEAERIAAMRGSPLVLTIEREGKPVEIRMSFDALAQAARGSASSPVLASASASKVQPPPGAAVIPIDFVRNVPVVEVEINGRGPYRMFLDTGAQGSVLDQTLADELSLPVIGETGVSSPGGKPIPAKIVRVDRVKAGGLDKSGVTAVVLDRSALGTAPDTPRGVLSANAFLEGSILTIDYPGRRVWIVPGELPAADGREIFEYGASERLPVVPLEIGGKKYEVHLDSGAPSTITLPLARAAELPLEAPPVIVGRGRRVDREVVIHGAKLRGAVKLGRYSFENLDLRFDDSVKEYGTVGYGVLKDFVVTLDKKNRRIRLQQAGEARSLTASAAPQQAMPQQVERRAIVPDPVVVYDGKKFEAEMKMRGPMPAVEVMVNGQGPFLFAIDTGGSGTARFDSSLVEKLKLETVGETRGSDGTGRGATAMALVKAASLKFGALELRDVVAASRNYNTAPNFPHIDGILGFGFFQDVLMTLDYVGKRVLVEAGSLPAPDGREVLAFEAPRGIPVIELRVGNEVLQAHVDAGNTRGLMLPGAVVQKMTAASVPRVIGKARTVSNEFEISEVQLKDEIRIGKHAYTGPVTFAEGFDHANIGSTVMAEYAVTFDQKNKRVRFVRGPRAGAPSSAAM